MPDYRLTVVIPTHARPEMLPRAVASALNQTLPCRVLVSDDGDCDRTAAILEGAFGEAIRSGQLIHHRSGATDAWSNWRAGAEAADTEFVTWLQDDDRITRRYSERIAYCFDRAPGSDVWMSRLNCADADGRFGLWFSANGPWVPMATLSGDLTPSHFSDGKALAASMYLTSWSLSPALAYRNGETFRAALAAMPPKCDIYVERVIPAEMAQRGGFIADPATVGYWVQHETNLSRDQHADQPRQTVAFHRHMDGLLDRLDNWAEPFTAWCRIIPPTTLIGWLGQLDAAEKEGGATRHGEAVRWAVMASLEGRIAPVEMPRRSWWRRLISRAG